MNFHTSLQKGRLLAIALASIAGMPLAAQAADVSVNFSMQVTAKNLDPRVEGMKLNCWIQDAAGQQTLASAESADVAVSGSFNGTLSHKVTVPAAKVKDAKKWACTIHLRGPNGQYFTGLQEWGHLEGNDAKSTVFGSF